MAFGSPIVFSIAEVDIPSASFTPVVSRFAGYTMATLPFMEVDFAPQFRPTTAPQYKLTSASIYLFWQGVWNRPFLKENM